MATKGTPKVGLTEIGTRVYVNGADLTLVAYTNTANSLTADSTVASLTQPTVANGYAPIVLDGTWSVVDGVVTYAHSATDPIVGAKPIWSATGTWSGTVTGTAMIFGSILMHFKDNAVPFVAASGKKLSIDISNLVGP